MPTDVDYLLRQSRIADELCLIRTVHEARHEGHPPTPDDAGRELPRLRDDLAGAARSRRPQAVRRAATYIGALALAILAETDAP